MRVRERERVMIVRERERERAMCVRVCERERESYECVLCEIDRELCVEACRAKRDTKLWVCERGRERAMSV
jgi:hypothetical protein